MRQLRGPGELRQRDAGVGGFADDTNVDCEGWGRAQGPRCDTFTCAGLKG